MSEWRDLAPRLPELPLESLFERYSRETGHQDLPAFVRWLQGQGRISPELASELQSELAVELTGLNVLAAYYDHTQAADLKQGDVLGPTPAAPGSVSYALLRQVGAGAMGSVHLAKDRLLRRTVAFKQLLPGVADPHVSFRFLGEAQLTSQLDHPHVIPIYGLEQRDGQIAYAMKMIQGQSLKQWIAAVRAAYDHRQVTPEYGLPARLRLFLKICDALAYAHSKGVIHRDLKPANIMLGRYGEVYVMDWGIARPFGEPLLELDTLEVYAQEAGQIVGTPRYMSPEQAAGLNEKLDQRSDLFALGLILFEMVSLEQAVQAPNMQAVLKAVVQGKLQPLVHRYGEPIAPALASIVHKATARLRRDRYTDVFALSADLRRYLQHEKVAAHTETRLEGLQRAVYRHRQRVVPLLMSLLLLGAGGTLGVQLLKQQQLARAEQHSLRVSALLAVLAQHGQALSGRFQLLEGELQRLSAAARVALQAGQPASGPYWLAADYVAGRAPADWLPAPATRRVLSLAEPVFKLAPGLTLPQAETTLRQLLPLNPVFQQLWRDSRGVAFVSLPAAEQTRQLREAPALLLNSYVGLPSGLHMSYPGKGGFAADYDPRLRPWYRLGESAPGPRWGLPFEDALGLGLVIPCVQSLRDVQGQVLGVAGIELSLTQVAQDWLPVRDVPHVQAVYLVTPSGDLVASAPQVSARTLFEAEAAGPRLADALAQPGSGLIERPEAGQYLAYAWLDHLGWYLVIRGDLTQMLAD